MLIGNGPERRAAAWVCAGVLLVWVLAALWWLRVAQLETDRRLEELERLERTRAGAIRITPGGSVIMGGRR